MKYIMSYKRSVPQLMLWKTNESIAIRIVEKSMGDHRANVEDIADVVEYIRNVDPEQFANIRNEVFEVLEEMDVDFEDIMDQDSDEEVLSDDTGCVSDLSEHDTDLAEKFVSSPEIRALNSHTKHCMIQCYYTMGGALNVCAACMIRLADIDVVGMHLVRKHDIDYIDALGGRSCRNCGVPTYTIFPCSMCPLCTH